ncbi:MAG: glycosyltransferase family 2 protein [Cyanophyceae cyanobacterium]
MPKVSVIIPAYNTMKYLPETVESVLQQTFTNFEAIVVNDASSDGVEQWVNQLSDPRVKLITHAVNQGLAKTRNTGIKAAQGELLAFLDGDDLWQPTKLAQQVQLLDTHPEVGLIYTWVAYIDEQGKATGRVFKHEAEGDVWSVLVQHNIVECGSVPLVRRECLETVGCFDPQLSQFNNGEDWDLWLRIAERYPFKVVKEPLVYYRQRPASGSRNWEAMEKSFHIVFEKAFASAAAVPHLRNKTYGLAHLCLAWKPLQSVSRDYQKAREYRRLALQYCPRLRFSKEYLRLSTAIFTLRWFGPDGYRRFLTVAYAVRRRLANSH